MITLPEIRKLPGADLMNAVIDILRDEAASQRANIGIITRHGLPLDDQRRFVVGALLAGAEALDQIRKRGVEAKERKQRPDPIVQLVSDLVRFSMIGAVVEGEKATTTGETADAAAG